MPASTPVIFLAVSLVWMLLALNTVRPVRWPASVSTISFFAGWLVGELALHFSVLQLLLAGSFVLYGGALAGWQGWAALALTFLGVAIVVRHYFSASDTHAVIDDALRSALGDDFDDAITPEWLARLSAKPDLKNLVAPFPINHVEVERVADRVYHQEGRLKLRLDVYRQKSTVSSEMPSGPRPALIYVHGGAWIIGRKQEQGLPLLYHLASLGWTCFTIDYRLSPRATFPDHLVDVKRAIAWVRAHAAEFDIDPSCIVLAGNSAGGHLSSLASLTENDARYQPGFEAADTSVAACVSFYGVYDLCDRHGSYSHRGLIRLIERHVMKAKLAGERHLWDLASPITRVHPDAPPFLLLHGDCDTLVPIGQARHFAEAFRAVARQPLALAEIRGAQHAFEIFPSLRTELTVRGVARFCAWVHATSASRRRPVTTHGTPDASPGVTTATG